MKPYGKPRRNVQRAESLAKLSRSREKRETPRIALLGPAPWDTDIGVSSDSRGDSWIEYWDRYY